MFHRSYDLSCVSNLDERTYIQNAINGVNAACSDMVDAWLYVERGSLLEDNYRTLDHNDHIPKTIFASMSSDNHSGNTFTFTPKKNFVGTATFYYTVIDIDGAKSSKTKITVTDTKTGKKSSGIRQCFIRTGC